MKTPKYLILPLLMLLGLHVSAQVIVDNTLTVQELVEEYLIGEGVTVQNVTVNGQPGNTVNNQIGLFSGNSNVIGFDQGIAMATGDASAVITGGFGDPLTNPITNDPDLMVLSGQNMNDVVIIEFDFVATSDSIKFNYVFASNEYPSYTCSNFNDVFGFFLSGPGINGPFQNAAMNIALIPGSDTPVGINTINSGQASGSYSPQTCADANPNWIEDSQYFVSNSGTPSDDVQFPGLTQTFTAMADVECGGLYHIKLAIGDASDGALDSGVFLEAGSFTAFGEVTLNVNPSIGGSVVTSPQYDSVLVAGCSEALIELAKPAGQFVDSIFVEFGGTAIEGEDYELGENDTLFFFPEGVDTLQFTVSTLWDGVYGENEILMITIFYQDGCGNFDSASVSIPIIDPYDLYSFNERVEIFCPTETVLISDSASNGIEPYIYDWGDYGIGESVEVNVPEDSAYYYVLVSDVCKLDTLIDSVLVVNSIPPPLEASIIGFEQPECTNQPIYTEALSSGGNGEHVYIWTDGQGHNYGSDTLIEVKNINQSIVFNPDPMGYTEYLPVYLTVTDTCGTMVKDSVMVHYPFFDPLTANFAPLEDNCPKDPVEMNAFTTGGGGDVEYTWSITKGNGGFADGYGNATQKTYVVPAPGMNKYTLVIRDKCNRAGYDYTYVDPDNPSNISMGGMAMHSDSLRVIALDKIMNVITPNGDNMNDFFVVEGINYFDDAHVQIFDRWGKIVFETKNYNSGSAEVRSGDAFDGQDFEAGTYFYVINVDSGECTTSGQFEILRKDN